MPDRIQLTIHAELLFEFDSMSQWANKAQSWFKPYTLVKTICMDVKGNVCSIGEDFMLAEKNDWFPIRVYKIVRSAEMNKKNHIV